MKFISHRGNLLSGQTYPKENTVQAVEEAISLDYDVEIDVWRTEDGWFLGHNKPENKVSIFFLIRNCCRLWMHCKNKEAFSILKWFGGFMHEDEPQVFSRTLLKTFKWNHSSNHEFDSKTICVMPELEGLRPVDYSFAYGVCSDDIANIEYEFTKYQTSGS